MLFIIKRHLLFLLLNDFLLFLCLLLIGALVLGCVLEDPVVTRIKIDILGIFLAELVIVRLNDVLSDNRIAKRPVQE